MSHSLSAYSYKREALLYACNFSFWLNASFSLEWNVSIHVTTCDSQGTESHNKEQRFYRLNRLFLF